MEGTYMNKYYLHGLQLENKLADKLRTSKYFMLVNETKDLYGNIHCYYEFKGYHQPLLCHITNNYCMVYSPYNYMGNYTYTGEDEITLHST